MFAIKSVPVRDKLNIIPNINPAANPAIIIKIATTKKQAAATTLAYLNFFAVKQTIDPITMIMQDGITNLPIFP